MSSGMELGMINQLYRELGQIATVPTRREVSLQNQLLGIYALVEQYKRPGEMPIDAVERIICAGIAALPNEATPQAKTQRNWARANGLEIVEGD